MNELIKIENGRVTAKTIAYLVNCKKAMEKAKEEYDKMQTDLLEAMEQNGILKIDTPEIAINYVAPREDERFDSKLLKETSPDLYDQFVKFTPVKASVRIKIKPTIDTIDNLIKKGK